MKTSIIRAGILAVLCLAAGHTYAKGPCDGIANAQQKQQCMKTEEQKAQQAKQQAQLKSQQESQHQAKLKAQKDAERAKQQAQLASQQEAQHQAKLKAQKDAERAKQQAQLASQQEAQHQAKLKAQKDAERAKQQAQLASQQEAQHQAKLKAQKDAERAKQSGAQKEASPPPTTAKGSVSGRLHKNTASGPPLDGVLVNAGGKSTTTGSDGKFKLDGIAPGSTVIAFSKSGYAAYQGSIGTAAGRNTDMGERWLMEKATVGAPVPPPTTAKGSVSGRLHKNTASGPPLDGVLVNAGGKSTTTGSDGKFKLDGIAPGSTVIAFSKSGYAAYQGSIGTAAGRNTDMGERWLMEKATVGAPVPPPTTAKGSVSGRLHKNTASGPPLDGVLVNAGGKSTTTGSDGKFKLDGIAPGSTVIAFSKSGYAAYQGSIGTAAGRNTDMGERWLMEKATVGAPVPPPTTAKGSVSGRLHKNTASGPPLDGVLVNAGGKSTTTGSDGKFKLDGIAPGSTVIAFSKSGYAAYQGSIGTAAGRNTDMGERWLMEKATVGAPVPPPTTAKGSVSGRLHKNTASGPPLDGVLVNAGGKSTTTGSDGKFKLDGIAPGSTVIAFSKSGYAAYQGSIGTAAGRNTDMGERWLMETTPTDRKVIGANVVSTTPNFSSPGYSDLNPLVKAGFGGQCTAFAWGRAYELTGKKMDSAGNANTWWSATGYQKGQTPKRGAIAVWEGDKVNPFGHAAIVEDVKSNGNIVINEANILTFKDTKYGGGYDNSPKERSMTNLKDRGRGVGKLRGFIYLD